MIAPRCDSSQILVSVNLYRNKLNPIDCKEHVAYNTMILLKLIRI